ncbi:hypothetical protein FRC18_006950 [Serendipita sp. 400]|nr:hypothetical protein FRC18_006950 [Serendipita sp. 400]
MPSSVLTFNELLDIKDSTPPGGVDKRDELEPSKPESTTLASGCCFCGACANPRKSESLGEGASDFERQPMATTVSFHGIAMHKSEESYPDVPRTTSALSLSTPALANESALEIVRTSSSAFSPADNQSLAASDSMLILAVSRDATAGSFTFVNRERSPSPRTSAPSASNLSLATSNETAFPPRGQLLQPPFPAAQNLSFAPYFRRVEEREMISCQICLEEEPLDESVVIQSCGHAFGRECMRSYILSRLDEMRFPIPCPCCSAADEPGANPSLVTSGIATQVNLSDADCARWDELEFLLHAVRFECGKCQKAHAMDRHKLVKEKSKKWIDCPTPGCDQTWCRHCQATIDPTSKKKHVCEGKKELKSLLKKEGWRHCPGCNIPVQKSSGCNHIACSAPGCNTHFCYRCGDILIRSVFGSEIHRAISNHFRRRLYFWRCSQFRDPNVVLRLLTRGWRR